MKEKIIQILNLFPEVTWDRFGGDPNSEKGINIFGWIPRADGKSDFLQLRIDHEGVWFFMTSSAKYSKEFAKRIWPDSSETPCQRVEDHFPGVKAVQTIPAKALLDREYMKLAGHALQSKLPDNHGFILLVAPYGDGKDNRLTYISTMDRPGAICTLKEFLIKAGAAEDWMKHIQ